MALKMVKGSIDRMFDKNLQDLVRGIRNHKEDEVSERPPAAPRGCHRLTPPGRGRLVPRAAPGRAVPPVGVRRTPRGEGGKEPAFSPLPPAQAP